jgi:hypothetical protein
MKRWWSIVCLSAALVAIGFLGVETRRLAELAGRQEVAARQATAEAVAAAAELARLRAAGERGEAPVEASSYAELALELATTRQQLASVQQLLADERAARARSAAAVPRDGPMPEGVRTALVALQEVLRAEGFVALRFLRARAIEAMALQSVEVLELSPDQLVVSFVHAQRMTAELDRAAGRLSLRFFTGERIVGGEAVPLPEAGFVLQFDDVDGRRFEQQLPFLVRAEGAYAAQPDPEEREPGLDPATRAQWLDRVDALLARSGTAAKWRMTRFRTLRDGWFLDCDLVATDAASHVVGGAHCARCRHRDRSRHGRRFAADAGRRLAPGRLGVEHRRRGLPHVAPRPDPEAGERCHVRAWS